jgi:hypothetical protein
MMPISASGQATGIGLEGPAVHHVVAGPEAPDHHGELGTVALATSCIIRAPCRTSPDCSALVPTRKPGTS